MILFRQAKFSSDILITNMAYEIALSIREAEVYGVSGKVGTGASSALSQAGYGLRFSMNPSTDSSGNTYAKYNQYFAFTDEPTTDAPAGQDNVYDYFYNPTGLVIDDAIVSPIVMSQGFIRRFCGESGGSYRCVNEGNAGVLHIVFVKPDPEARITMGYDSNTPVTNNGSMLLYSNAVIVIESAIGDKCRTIRVSGAGQASVDPINPADTNGGCDAFSSEIELSAAN